MPELLPIAGPIVGGLLGGSGGSSQSGNQTITNKTEIDPKMAAILYGNGRQLRPGVSPIYSASTAPTKSRVWQGSRDDGGWVDVETPGTQGALINPESDYINDSGVLARIVGLFDQKQNPGISNFGGMVDSLLGSPQTKQQMQNSFDAAGLLQNSNINAPSMQAALMQAAQMQAAKTRAPSQNNTNLSPAYQDFIYGNPAENPYLTGAIQKGINQSNNSFKNMLQDATRNLTENILPSIRHGSIANGNYGGSRQGIAEGRAIGQYGTDLARAISQYGQNNTDSAVSARAGAFDAGRNRALSALGGLSANQYGVATNDAQMQQQANANNMQALNSAQQNNMQALNSAQQNNMQAQLSTNNLNSGNRLAGINAMSGLLGNAYNYGTNADAYNLNKVGKVSGLLTPYTGLGGSSSQTSPLYENRGAGMLSGALAGGTLGKMFGGGGGFWMDPQGSAIDYGGSVRDGIRGAFGY